MSAPKFLKLRWVVLLWIGILAFNLLGAILRVNSTASMNGTGENWELAFTKIQDAINTASAGDEIWVASGIYGETIFLRHARTLV